MVRGLVGLAFALLCGCSDNVGQMPVVTYGSGSPGAPAAGGTANAGSTPRSPTDPGTPPTNGTPTAPPSASAAPPGPPVVGAGVQISAGQAAELDLRAQLDLPVTVAPTTGFSGVVSLGVVGAPPGVTAVLDKPSVTLAGSAAGALLHLETASTVPPGTANMQIVAQSSYGTVSIPLSLTIKPSVTVTITPSGFVPADLTLHLAGGPIAVRVYNADGSTHQIHADNAGDGFAHGEPFGAGQFEGPTQAGSMRAVNSQGTYDYYLHDDSQIRARIVVQ